VVRTSFQRRKPYELHAPSEKHSENHLMPIYRAPLLPSYQRVSCFDDCPSCARPLCRLPSTQECLPYCCRQHARLVSCSSSPTLYTSLLLRGTTSRSLGSWSTRG
jgi:hypothetical protein